MTFSFNLVLGLFLLAPGFAVFAGLYHGSQLGLVRSPPPPPGSILALTIVSLGALTAHFVGALLFALQDFACEATKSCFRLGFDPNAYEAIFNFAENKYQHIPNLEGLEILGTLILVSGLAFISTQAVVGTKLIGDALKGILYGGWSDVIVASDKNQAVLAYVLSDVQEDGTVVGYEGVVANMTTDANKEVTSVLMNSCETFYLRVTPRGVFRKKVDRDSAIPQLYLDKSRIQNIAFELIRLAPSKDATP